MEYRIIKADEARKLTNESNFMKKSIYKWIREEAVRNRSSIEVPMVDFDESLFNPFIEELKLNGYKVELNVEYPNTVIISW